MALVFEVLAGIALTGTLAVTAAVLVAFELGRAVSRDDEQREAPTVRFEVRPRRAA